MKALTLWQPWASLITHGPKRIENRTWFPRWILNQRIAIHAGKRFDRETWEDYREDFIYPYGSSVDEIPRGAILGSAIVIGCVYPDSEEASRWPAYYNPGSLGWKLDSVVALPEPIPCRGAQGLWDVPVEIERKILESVSRQKTE